jgi:ATP-dependent RNA helicase DeaD
MSDSPTELPPAPVDPQTDYVSEVAFDDLGLSPELRKAVAERGYVSPTPVQARAWKAARAGKDLIVRSKTGTGKTAAFGMPLIDQIPVGTRQVKAIVLCPTRELAVQVCQELESLAIYRDIAVTAIYGGDSMQRQNDALRDGSAIVVGTPGRVADHIRRGTLKLDACSHAVLDEADEMLNQGFYEEVTRILDVLPAKRQVMLFSATVPEDIQRLIHKYTTSAETLLLSGDVFTVDHINHIRYELSDAYPKPRNLLYMLELEDPENAIIFCNTRDDTELVTAVLNRVGMDAEMLNGDLPQKERERVMARVKKGELAFMVATDLAARGIDISDLGHVINYSLPEDPAVYLHRVGRTGRIGKKGTALNLTSGRELATLTSLEKKYNIQFEVRKMPTPEEAEHLWAERHVRELKDAAQHAVFEGFFGLAASIKARPDSEELISFMLKYFFAHRRMERAQTLGIPVDQPKQESKGPRRERERERERDREGGGRRGRDRDRDRDRPPHRERAHDEPRAEASSPVAAAPASQPASQPASPPAHQADTVEAIGERSHRDRRPRRDERPTSEVAGTSEPSSSRRSDRELHDASPRAGQGQAPSAAAAPASRPAAVQGAPKKKLSDRELFELLQAGKPLPPMDDPTVEDGGGGGGEGHRDRDRDRDRERRPRRRERSEAPAAETAPGQTRLWLNLGRMDNVDETSLLAALETLGAPTAKVARTELRGTYSYLHVADADAPAFEALAGKQHHDKAIKVERARK